MDHLHMRPEREPLRFNLDNSTLSEDVVAARTAIKQAAEKLLYHWKSVPMNLPPSILDDQIASGDSHNVTPIVNLKDLFVAPTFNEVDQVARDAKGNTRRLNRRQLSCVKRLGEFEVESMNFPGQVHRWRLSQLLQKGVYNTHETFLNDLALSLKMLIIYSKDRFVSRCLSLSESVKSLWLFAWQSLDILFGMARTEVRDLPAKLFEEHSRFLVTELDIKPGSRQEWMTFCNYVKEKCRTVKMENLSMTEFHPPSFPYVFLTPSKIEIDMRLFNRELFRGSEDIIKKILDQESGGWYIKYKDQIIKELKGRDMTHTEIKEHVHTSIRERYQEKVFNAIVASEELENIQPGMGELLVAQAKCALFIERNLCSLKEKFKMSEQEHQTLLVKKYPLRSRIQQWVDRKLQQYGQEFVDQHVWDPHYQTINDCRVHGLEQMMYFLYRDLIFMRDREPVLKKELGRVKVPCREFTFMRYIWFPKNWIVKKHHHGEVQVLPTVVSKTYFLSNNQLHSEESDDPTYTLEKTKTHQNSSGYIFWRVVNFFHRAFVWTTNVMFFLGVAIPWCSPVSLRTLFGPRPFMSSFMLNPLNGEVCPDPSSKRNTLMSRLEKLWGRVKQSRRRFECEPETGFLGKSLTRHFNRVWNYVFKGFFGSLVLVVFFVPVCLACSLSSVALAVLAPVWVPVGVLALHLFGLLIYDFDHPDDSNRWFYLVETFVFRLLLHGILQPICALLLGLLILPASSVVILFGCVLRRLLRTLWDTLMFHCIIKKRGRIPGQDGFIARRIAGPGLASNHYFQVRPEQALAAVEACMEVHEIDAWYDCLIDIIERPEKDFRKFAESCFGPFSGMLNTEGAYQKLVTEAKGQREMLWEKAHGRKQKLWTDLEPDIQSKIRLTSRELKVVLAQTSKMLEEFYPARVLSRLQKPEDKFWEEKRLDFRDWHGFAKQLLTEVFSSSIITPLEEIDTCFKLNVEHLNLMRYLEMLKSAEFEDDLDVVSTVHTPKGDIDVDPPEMNPRVFDPSHDELNHVHNKDHLVVRRRFRKISFPDLWSLSQKLSLPLPIAHPSVVAIIIHNRDENRHSIHLDNEVCRRILVAIELSRDTPAVVEQTDPNAGLATPVGSNLEGRQSGTRSPQAAGERAEEESQTGTHQNVSTATYTDNQTPESSPPYQLVDERGLASTSSVGISISNDDCSPENAAQFRPGELHPMPRHSKSVVRDYGDDPHDDDPSRGLMGTYRNPGTL